MNKAYWIAPFAALLVFAGIFINFKSGYAAREKAVQEHVQAEKQLKLQAEVQARRKLVDDALRLQAQRKKEREAKEVAEKARKDERQAALDTRDKAFREQEKLAKQVDNLKKELIAEQAPLAKTEMDRKDAVAEQEFLKTYIEKAKANVQALADVLTKIAAAEQARQAAEAAAATAKKSS
jgi:hypothetical protein